MDASSNHDHQPDVSFDGGDLDCGNGLLLLIRRHIDPMGPGQLLEIRSTESSVEEDLPAWCRLTGNPLLSWTKTGSVRSFLVSKGPSDAKNAPSVKNTTAPASAPRPSHPSVSGEKDAPPILPFSVMGMGSWPRPRWMVNAIHEHISGRLSEAEFHSTADDAVRLAMMAQIEAGADVITDGEQRRDSYASFVGGILDNTQLIPLSDLSAMVEDPEEFMEELRALDVPANDVRHPVVFGKLGRSRSLAVHELACARSMTQLPVKVALPGPYLLTRTLWLDCLLERAYPTREALAADVVKVLREEIVQLLEGGAALVQLDEPVLSEVVFTGAKAKRSFMCGALSEKGDKEGELDFARELLNAVIHGFPRERLGLHVCRGNWTRDEGALLSGDYRPLTSLFSAVSVGTLFLEFSTPRAGELSVLTGLPDDCRLGLGVVNPRSDRIETPEEITARANEAVQLLGRDRVLLNSDCGFATFADNPVASANVARAKIAAMAEAAKRLRGG